MKILILNYEFPPLGGGASPVSYEIAKGYAKLGHKVDVVTMHYQNLPYFEKKDGINIHRVKCLRIKKEICHPWEQLTYIISAKRFLKKHLKKNCYDINHTHFIIPTGIISLWLKKKYDLDYIITSHGSDVPGLNPDRFKFLHKFTGPILRKVGHRAKKIVAPSRYLGFKILEEIDRNLENKIEYIPNGININKFIPEEKKKVILSTGRLLPRKGFQYLIQAISNKDLGYEVHIAGDGPMMAELKRLAKQSKTKIVFHGWIDNNSQEYKELLGSAAIYCLVSPKENASISLLEAMSAGCAVIACSEGGGAETVEGAGLVVEPKNKEQIKKTIGKLVNDKNLLKNISKKAREKVLNNFNWDKIIKNYERILLNGKKF
jgi:glycosyltransferase involved in cell wall biosynthesis